VIDAIAALPQNSTISDWVQVVGDTYFPLFVANMDFFVVLHFWGVKAPRAELAASIRSGYELTQVGFSALYQQAFDHYNLEVKPTHTVQDLTVMVTAALEGFALRHHFDPEHVTNTNDQLLFTELLQTIVRDHLTPKTNTP